MMIKLEWLINYMTNYNIFYIKNKSIEKSERYLSLVEKMPYSMLNSLIFESTLIFLIITKIFC